MESIMKEDIWGFFHASMLDPSQQELINESTAKPMQLNEQEYQSLCELINHEHPANDHEWFVLSQQALSMQRISIRACLIALQALKIAISCFSPVTSQHPSTYKRLVLFRRSFSTCPYHMIRSATLRCESWAQLTLPMVMLCDGRTSAGQLCVIRALQVISHFASTEMRGTLNNHLIHVLPLDWVRNNSPC